MKSLWLSHPEDVQLLLHYKHQSAKRGEAIDTIASTWQKINPEFPFNTNL